MHLVGFIIRMTVTCSLPTLAEYIVAFPLQQWLRQNVITHITCFDPPLPLPTNLCEGDFLVSVYIALIWHSVSQTSCSRASIWLRKVTTDPHIRAHVNIICPDVWHPELKVYSSELFMLILTNLMH